MTKLKQMLLQQAKDKEAELAGSPSLPVERLVMPGLRDMEEAPKDGTKIIIFWYDENLDCRDLGVRKAWWWKPTLLSQRDAGARPHWEYINDKDFCSTIHRPLGWLPLPEIQRA